MMRAESGSLWVWCGVAAALLVVARLGAATTVLQGVSVGLLVGTAYVWLLWRRTRTSAALPVRRAVLAARLGTIGRLVFVLLTFAVAERLWPHAGLGWGCLSFFAPVVVRMIGLARGVGG